MRGVVIVAALMALAGCGGSPSGLVSDVEVFSAGVGKAEATYREERAFYVSYLEGLETRDLLRERPALLDGPTLGACNAWISEWQNQWDGKKGVGATSYKEGINKLSVQCRLHKAQGNDAKRLDVQVGDPTPNHTRLAAALESYARKLAELANSAGSRQDFNDAAQKAKGHFLELLASARNIGVSLGNPVPLNIDAELSAIGSVLVDAVGAALEARRRRALARIVEATHPAVVEAANHLAAIARFYHVVALPRLAAAYESAVDRTGRRDVKASNKLYGEALQDVINSHEALITFASLDPGEVFDSMITAHLALGRRLDDPEVRLADLAGSLENFSFNAERAVGAIRGVRVKLQGRPGS